MKAPILRRAVAVALGIALPGFAAALSFTGLVGLRYDRLDNWTPAGAHLTLPTTGLDGNLDATGYLLSPRILRWGAGVNYGQTRSSYGVGDTTSTGLGYRLSADLFEFRGSKMKLGGSASRGTIDASIEPDSGLPVTGTTTEQTYLVHSLVAADRRPSAWASALRREATNTGFGRAEITDSTNQINAGLQHGPGPFQYVLDYSGRWNEGSLGPLNFRSHLIGLSGTALIAPNVTGFANSRYSLRIPEVEDPLNPRVETNTVGMGARWRGGDDLSGSTAYTYAHFLLLAPAATPLEQVSHSLSTDASRPFGPRWTGGVQVVLSLGQSRLGTEEQIDAGQTVGATVGWRRPADEKVSGLGFEAGPLVGVLEPQTGSTTIGYGVRSNASWASRTGLAPTRYAAGYGVEYAKDLFGQPGWTLTQNASASASTLLTSTVRASGALVASGARRETPLFGGRSSRAVTASGGIGWRAYSLEVSAGLNDGVTGSLSQSALGDGLFFPEKYDTHSRYATAQAVAQLTRRMQFTAVARYALIQSPSIPEQREASIWGTIRYTLGRFQLSVENRYSVGGTTALDDRSNLLLVRLSRFVGGRF